MVLVVSDKEKDTSSTSGMETSRLTSLLLQHRASHIVQQRLDEIEQAYLNKDFETFGRITMQDSNQFHAVCLDTYPPIFYMNDVSKLLSPSSSWSTPSTSRWARSLLPAHSMLDRTPLFTRWMR